MIQSPICYVGNKFKQLQYILPCIDTSKNNFIDLFTGSGTVYVNQLAHFNNIYVNDCLAPLIEIHKSIIKNPGNFKTAIRNIGGFKAITTEEYNNIKEEFNRLETPELFYCLIHFAYRHDIRFDQSGMFVSSYNGKRLWGNVESKIDQFVKQVNQFHPNLYFSSVSFDQFVIPSNSMVFIDPPYQNCIAGYGQSFFKQNREQKLLDYINQIDRNNNSFMLCGTLVHNGIYNEFLHEVIVLNPNYNFYYLPNQNFSDDTIEIMVTNYNPPVNLCENLNKI